MNEVEVEVDVKSMSSLSLSNRSIEERASSTMLKVEGDFLIETSTMTVVSVFCHVRLSPDAERASERASESSFEELR
jgi:hypothetical protein